MSLSQALVNSYQTLAFGSITGSFVAVGSVISLPISIFRLVNATDQDMIFSIDGVSNQFYVIKGTSVLYDIATNHGLAQSFELSGHIQFYVKQVVAPGSGSVVVESISPNIQTPSLYA